jgi:tetratricopeptide (TPR) repeat protein
VGCASGLAEAHNHFGDDRPGWRNKVLLDWQNAGPGDKLQATSSANQYLKTKILEPLERAVAADPGDAAIRVELAQWYGEQWKLFQDLGLGKKALSQANQAQRLDPDNAEAYRAEAHLHNLFAQGSDTGKTSHYQKAAVALQAAAERDPKDAQFRYELAEALFQANNPAAAREQASIALSLDQHAPAPERRLIPAKREQLQKWLQTSVAN